MKSDAIKTGPDRAPARAMLRATGLDDAAIARPIIAVVHSWSDVSPCNINLRDLAQHVREGIIAGGGLRLYPRRRGGARAVLLLPLAPGGQPLASRPPRTERPAWVPIEC